MKVHYESIMKAMDRAIDAADRNDRRIERIELTPREWSEFLSAFVDSRMYPGPTLYQYNGIPVEKSK